MPQVGLVATWAENGDPSVAWIVPTVGETVVVSFSVAVFSASDESNMFRLIGQDRPMPLSSSVVASTVFGNCSAVGFTSAQTAENPPSWWWAAEISGAPLVKVGVKAM